MRKHIFAFFVFLLSLSTLSDAGLITDVDIYGRDVGYYQSFTLKKENGITYLVMAKCYPDRLVPRNITSRNCLDDAKKIELNSALEDIQKGFSTEVFVEILKRQQLQLKKNAAVLSEEIKDYAPKANGKDPLLEEVTSRLAKDASSPLVEDSVDPTLTGYLEILSQINDPKKDFFVLYDNRKNDEAQYRLSVKLVNTFTHTFYKDFGFFCKNSDDNLVENKNGGCLLKSTGVTYSVSMSIGDKSNNGMWLNRDIAKWRCESLSAGGFRDWRLPTEPELLSAKLAANSIGFDPFLYYWTSDKTRNEQIDHRTYKLGNQVESESKESVLIGMKSSDIRQMFSYHRVQSSAPAFSDKTTTVTNTNRVLAAQFNVEERTYRLVRPEREAQFDIKRYRLLGAVGTLSYDKVKTVESPDFVYNKNIDMFGTGDVLYSIPTVATWKKSETFLGSHSEKVNPLDYIHYDLPKDVEKSEIALICVRAGR